MSGEAKRRAYELFDRMCDLDEEARAATLEAECGSDAALRQAVERMLRQDATAQTDLLPGEGAKLIAAELAEADSDQIPGRIGRYRVTREVGRGGMGVVYEAEQDEPKRRVAVKVIRDGVASREVVRRFQQESQLLGRLQHPGIAQVYEAGTDVSNSARRSYYAMEFIDGSPLDRHADERGLGIDERVELMARVCDAVHHAHQKGILHRDLKVANVLVATSVDESSSGLSGSRMIDGIGQPKIVDFGIARLTEDTDGVTKQTHVGQIIGSLACMSPEQLSGDGDSVDTRTDVYAIGVMLFRLLSGRPPHDLSGMSIAEAARAVTEKDPPTLSSVSHALRGDLSVITAKALERDIDRRYESVAELGEDLRRTLRDEPITARPQTSWYRIRKFTRRHRVAVSFATAGLVLLFAATGISIGFGIHAVVAQKNADRAAYRAAIAAAAAAIREGDIRLAREFLARAPESLRGWEWRHYQGETDRSLASGFRANALGRSVADYVYGGLWLSDDGTVLHAAAHYLRKTPGVFESFDAGTLESLAHWTLDHTERCLGVVRGPLRGVFFDSESREYVFRDLTTGEVLERRGAGPEATHARASYDELPGDERLMAWLHRATMDARGGSHMGTVSPDASAWIYWHGLAPVVWPPRSDGTPVSFGTMREGVSRVRFSPDGNTVAITTLDRRVDVYNATTGESVWGRAEAHGDAPMAIAFSPDARILATGGQDRVIKLWDAASGAPIGQFMGHESTVVALSFSFDGETLYSADATALRRWRVREASEPGVIVRHNSFVYDLVLSDDGSMLASRVPSRNITNAPTREIILYDTRSELPSREILVPSEIDEILNMTFVDSGRFLVVGLGRSQTDSEPPIVLAMYDSRTGAMERARNVGSIPPGPIEIRGGKVVIMSDPPMGIEPDTLGVTPVPERSDAKPKLRLDPRVEWVAADGEVLHSFLDITPDKGAVTAIDEARLRAYVATSSGLIHVLDLRTGTRTTVVNTHGVTLRVLALLPDGTRLFGGSGDTSIRVWDTSSMELAAVLRGHRDTVTDLAISPDGSTLYSASDDYTVRKWVASQPSEDAPFH